MKWASAIRESRSSDRAIDGLTKDITKVLKEGIDLAFLFVSPYFKNEYDLLPGRVYDALGCPVLIGCSGGGVIGDGREIERQPAISILAASLPGVSAKPFHLDRSDLPDLDASPKEWQSLIGHLDKPAPALSAASHPQPGPQPVGLVLLADPFTIDVERGIEGLDYAYPHAAKIGGLASGAEAAGQNGLFMNKNRYRSGMVGVSLSGNIAIDTIVAQGCRPIGKPFSITRCDKNKVLEIDGQKPMAVLQNLYQELSEDDQKRVQRSLFIGLAMTPFKEDLSRGDFLIQNLTGMDSSTGAIILGAMLEEGQTGQFHLRDKETSAEDLMWHLTQYEMEIGPKSGCGALLFSCMGRGAHLYGEPDFDTHLFHARLGSIPLAGFFCNGEIGAVGQTTFLHGYTSCFGIFRSAS